MLSLAAIWSLWMGSPQLVSLEPWRISGAVGLMYGDLSLARMTSSIADKDCGKQNDDGIKRQKMLLLLKMHVLKLNFLRIIQNIRREA